MASDDYISDFGSSQTPDQRHLHKLLRKNDLTNDWGNKCDRNIDCDAVVFILVHVVFGWNFSDSLISKFWAIVFLLYAAVPDISTTSAEMNWNRSEVK